MTRSLVIAVKFKNIKGLDAKIFALLILFLPVNLAKHFFFDFVYVEGVLVDYLIPTVYLTDVLVLTLLLLWLFRSLRCGQSRGTYRGTVGIGLGLILVSGLSVFNALNQPAAVYKWLKLLEYVLFSFYVSKHIDLKKDFSTIVKLLSIGVLLESVLVIAQWFHQGSIFGYWFLGENSYTVSTPGIATFDFGGVKKVRPYGTFPHPNVLGGYLAVLLPWVAYELRSRIKNKELGIKGFYFLSLCLGLAALFLSFSRSAWAAGFLAVLLILTSGFKGLISTFNFSLLTLNPLSFLRRAELNWIALQTIRDHPFLGVGLNNFTVRMDEYGRVSGWVRFLQPVHNLYLLVAAEVGLLGLSLFVGLLFSAFRFLLRNRNYLLLIALAQVILLGFFDHYFWTIQQTSLLLWLLVGLVYNQGRE